MKCFAIFTCYAFLTSCSKEEKIFSRNTSPSKKYNIEIYAYYPKGQSGVARLIYNKTGEVLIEKEMTSVRYDFSVIMWDDSEVTLGAFATWPLNKGRGGVGTQDVQYCYGDFK